MGKKVAQWLLYVLATVLDIGFIVMVFVSIWYPSGKYGTAAYEFHDHLVLTTIALFFLGFVVTCIAAFFEVE